VKSFMIWTRISMYYLSLWYELKTNLGNIILSIHLWEAELLFKLNINSFNNNIELKINLGNIILSMKLLEAEILFNLNTNSFKSNIELKINLDNIILSMKLMEAELLFNLNINSFNNNINLQQQHYKVHKFQEGICSLYYVEKRHRIIETVILSCIWCLAAVTMKATLCCHMTVWSH
jgi:hypothetical protein